MSKKKRIILLTATLCVLGALAILVVKNIKGKDGTLEREVRQQIYEEMAPQLLLSEDERSFWDAYLNGQEEISPKERLLALQAEKVAVRVLSAKKGNVKIEIQSPNLALLLQSIVKKMPEDDISPEALEMQMIQALENGAYEVMTKTVQMSYTKNGTDGITIRKTEEYLDALYGGLVSAYQDVLVSVGEG